jgi:hypothetical protein
MMGMMNISRNEHGYRAQPRIRRLIAEHSWIVSSVTRWRQEETSSGGSESAHSQFRLL